MQNAAITQQVQSLKTHRHITNIAEIKPLCFKLSYSPQGVSSAYSAMSYGLKLAMNGKYPQTPPTLTFLDKIYHLNVNPTSGLVRMAILNEDWSPYLTLASVIDSLDSILEQPDAHCPATESLLDEFKNARDQYEDNVHASIKFETDHKIEQEEEKDHSQIEKVEEVVDANDITEENFFKGSSQLRQLKQFQHVKQSLILSENEALQILLKKSSENGEPDIVIKQSTKADKKSEPKVSANSSGSPFKQNNSKKSQPLPQKYQEMTKALQQTNNLIQIFSKECESMQARLKSTENQKIKRILSQKLEKEESMLMELFEISSDIKLKLMQLVKKGSQTFIK